MKIVRLIIEVEDVDNEDFNIVPDELNSFISKWENDLAESGYSIYDQRIETEEV